MSKTVIDGIIKDWGERLHYSPVKGSKGRNIRSGGTTGNREAFATERASHEKRR